MISRCLVDLDKISIDICLYAYDYTNTLFSSKVLHIWKYAEVYT